MVYVIVFVGSVLIGTMADACHTPTTHAPTTRAGSRASNETEPETPGQDDDPDRIDDVV